VAAGDSGREAYTAIAWGVGLSLERSDIAGAESFYSLEGNMCGTVKARCCRPAGVEGHNIQRGISGLSLVERYAARSLLHFHKYNPSCLHEQDA
jgi:hypothetical protein